jgi:hypothetical protein
MGFATGIKWLLPGKTHANPTNLQFAGTGHFL